MRIYDGRTSFYQWDLDQKITSDKFAVGDEIHFSNVKQINALVVKAYELNGRIVADVPNILLQSSYPITAWRYVYDEYSAQTTMKDTFKVVQRPQPHDYIYTETELYEFRKEVLKLCNEAVSIAKSVEERANSGEFDGDSTEVSQTTGQSTTAVMSQNAVTEELAKKLDKVSLTGKNLVYGVDVAGEQKTFPVTAENWTYAIAMRNNYRTFDIGEPVKGSHPATKNYVDAAIAEAIGEALEGDY